MKKVIIVEDNTVIKFFLVTVVKKMGHEVLQSLASSNNLFEVIKGNRPDLVLMDIGIGGQLDGIASAKILIQEHNIPVVFITGNSDHATQTKTESVGALEIIHKPVDGEKLQKQLKLIFDNL